MRSADWRVIAQREIGVKLRDKVFVGSTVFMIVVLVASVGLSTFFGNKLEEPTVAVLDGQGTALVEAANELADEQDLGLKADTQQVDDVAKSYVSHRPVAARERQLEVELGQPVPGADLGQAEIVGDRSERSQQSRLERLGQPLRGERAAGQL